VRNRGCSGLAYNLEYVDKPGAFDETVEQDGVKVLIDSKALFSIIGSEMDWVEDKLSQRFVFRNPNISEYPFVSFFSLVVISADGEQRSSVGVVSRLWYDLRRTWVWMVGCVSGEMGWNEKEFGPAGCCFAHG